MDVEGFPRPSALINGVQSCAISTDVEKVGSSPNISSSPHFEIESRDQLLYSIFTPWQKRWINLLSSFAAMFSTMSSYIYFPALVPIADDLRVSVALINLTVTSYLIMAAVAPAFMGDMADQGGRRPIYILMFMLMLGANVGMAIQTSFPALLILRMLQSAGASGLIGAAYGIIADITVKEERGGFIGILLLLTDIAPSLGPVIGGIITQTLGWRWVFWFLLILQGAHFLLILLFLPETQRNIVGNGRGRCKGIYWSVPYVFQNNDVKNARIEIAKPRRHYPNPLACLPILANKDSLFTIIIYAITYAVKMTLQTSLGAQCVEIYQLNYLNGGLIYISSGVAGGIGSYMTGKFLDRNYRQAKERLQDHNHVADPRESPDFQLEKLRLKGIYILITVTVLGTVGYGLSLMTKAHISVMLVMQFLTGMTTASTFTMTSTLLTDLNVDLSATAQGASSIVRCILAGGAIAAMEPLAKAIGLGWCFAMYAVLVLVNLPLAWSLMHFGCKWRKDKVERRKVQVIVQQVDSQPKSS